jgi:hypothetical protein
MKWGDLMSDEISPSPNEIELSDALSLSADKKRKAGHYEILGETYAKFEFFENGWNPYSRFLDVDKVDLILRKVVNGVRIYREVQVKYGKLFRVGTKFEKSFFDLTSFRFFKENEFIEYVDRADFFIAYVLAEDVGYAKDIFIFPIADFARLLQCAIRSKDKRKVYISRLHVIRTGGFFGVSARFLPSTKTAVSMYRYTAGTLRF